MPYFHKILNDYFEDSEIDAYEKKLLTDIHFHYLHLCQQVHVIGIFYLTEDADNIR